MTEKVWLLWEVEDYEKDSLEGVFSTEEKAERARTRLRNKWRREYVGYGVGPDGVYETKRAAHNAADQRASDHLYILCQVVR